MTISGGTYTGQLDSETWGAVYSNSAGKLTISGGTITGQNVAVQSESRDTDAVTISGSQTIH